MQNVVAAVSLKRILHNARALAQAAQGKKLYAVVKDDAYGHGAAQVAHALSGIAKAFAVATVDEGAALRLAGTVEDILVLTPPLCEEEVLRISSYGLIASITSAFVLKTALQAVKKFKVDLRVHLAVNTGMNRYGFSLNRLSGACVRAGAFKVEGLYSHLYLPASEAESKAQEALFLQAERIFKQYYPDGVCHLSATGGALKRIKTDMVRAGLALYGYLPEGFEGRLSVKPAMKIYATVANSCKTVGEGLGYRKQQYPVQYAHTLRLGYGDGFFRAGGKLCMDACVLEGKRRTGTRERVLLSVEEYAAQNGTTAYEALVNIARRAERRYDF